VVNKRVLMENFNAVVTDPRLRLDALQQHLANLHGDDCYLGQYRVVATAGTSGLRGVFVYDREAWRIILANTLRWHRFIGIRPRLPRRIRICSIGADNSMHVSNRIPVSGDVGLFRLMPIKATESLGRQVALLNAFQPDVLLPYASVAALLAREQIDGRLAIHPRVVATHSELLTAEMTMLIERAWGNRPFNHYGLTEEPHVGSDCALHEGIHLFEDTTMIEVVDDEYRRVRDGQMGTRFLLTNLYNLVQPLIRYDITDMLCLSEQPCGCGRPFALIKSVGGRAEDMLTLARADGTGDIAVSPMVVTLAVESFLGIREYMADHGPEGIRLFLVLADDGDRQRIETELPQRLHGDLERQGAIMPTLTISFVDALDRSAQRMGKISLVERRHETVALPSRTEPAGANIAS